MDNIVEVGFPPGNAHKDIRTIYSSLFSVCCAGFVAVVREHS
jgi:hypothetical protein